MSQRPAGDQLSSRIAKPTGINTISFRRFQRYSLVLNIDLEVIYEDYESLGKILAVEQSEVEDRAREKRGKFIKAFLNFRDHPRNSPGEASTSVEQDRNLLPEAGVYYSKV